MDLPLEEGYVYGQKPKQPSPPPDINAVFEEVGVPKGKLGELPFSKEWYDGAKERARLRAIEMDELYVKKDQLRQDWVTLALADCIDQIEQVDHIQAEIGPVLGLAELLARAAHERPEDEERIDRLNAKAEQAEADQARLKAALEAARDHLSRDDDAIRKKEREDAAAEADRVEEKRREEERRRKAEKILARQAALLRGEELPPSDDELDDTEQGEHGEAYVDKAASLGSGGFTNGAPSRADGGGGAVVPNAETGYPASTRASPKAADAGALGGTPAGASLPRAPTFLAPAGLGSPSPHPSPELRVGPARQLPPLQVSPRTSENGGAGAGVGDSLS